MYNTLEKTKQIWGGKNEVIDYWLELRHELLVNLSKVAGMTVSDKRCLPTEKELSDFCAALIDYVSAGHFRIYNRVIERWTEKGIGATKETDALYFNIVETTRPLVAFNDKYVDAKLTEDNSADFDKDVSDVAELIELRFQFEDALIQLIADSINAK